MAKLLLGVNCNCFTNRYTEPAEWTRVCAEDLGIFTVQYSIDLLDPYYPWKLQRRICDETLAQCAQRGIKIKVNFGGHFSHQHYLGHPDPGVRAEAERWFKRMIDQTAYLGAEGTGTCFALMTVRDNAEAARREKILQEAIAAYGRLAEYAGAKGLQYLMFEPTSVPRESCATIAETRRMVEACEGMAVPMLVCLDVGHRNVASGCAADGDPMAWIQALGAVAPVIHLQQTDHTGSNHWPFTPEKNAVGIIAPERIVAAATQAERKEILFAFETGAKAFSPYEDNYLKDLKTSVAYWRQYVKN